jgi:hypothetical protein
VANSVTHGLCVAVLLLFTGFAEAGSPGVWPGQVGGWGGPSRVWREPSVRDGWGGSARHGVHSGVWPQWSWVDRLEPEWTQGGSAHVRPRTICVKPLPGYDYTGWEAAPPHRLLPADYRCIEMQ